MRKELLNLFDELERTLNPRAFQNTLISLKKEVNKMDKILTDNDLLDFRKEHKGKRLIDVPGSYLLWMYQLPNLKPAIKAYIEDNLEVIKAQAKKESKYRN